MLERDLAHDRQPQPAALTPAAVGAPVEAVENVREILPRSTPEPWSRTLHAPLVDHDVDPRSGRRMAGGIVEQIVHRPAEPLGYAVS